MILRWTRRGYLRLYGSNFSRLWPTKLDVTIYYILRTTINTMRNITGETLHVADTRHEDLCKYNKLVLITYIICYLAVVQVV